MKLELHGITIQYRAGGRTLTAVDGVDLAIPAGATVGLVGESGCGKSSLARGVVGLVPLAAGRVSLDGVEHGSRGVRRSREFRRRVQMVFQDPYSSLNPRLTVGEMIVEALSLRNGGNGQMVRAAEIIEQVGLGAAALSRYPHQFSGGQRQRIATARALAVGAELLILDEVTSSLDVSVQATILNLLRDLQRELDLSYLVISHDLSVVRYMSDSVAVMYLGRIVETAPTSALFRDPEHPYTHALINSVPQFRRSRARTSVLGDVPDPTAPPSGCRFHTRCPVGPLADPARTLCLTSDPQSGAVSRNHGAACHFARPRADAIGLSPEDPLAFAGEARELA